MKNIFIIILLLHCILVFSQPTPNNKKVAMVMHDDKILNINNYYMDLNNDLSFNKYMISDVNIICKNKYLINIKCEHNSDTTDFLGFVNTTNNTILWIPNDPIQNIKVMNGKVYILTEEGKLRCYTSSGYEFNILVYLLAKQKIKLVKYSLLTNFSPLAF